MPEGRAQPCRPRRVKMNKQVWRSCQRCKRLLPGQCGAANRRALPLFAATQGHMHDAASGTAGRDR